MLLKLNSHHAVCNLSYVTFSSHFIRIFFSFKTLDIFHPLQQSFFSINKHELIGFLSLYMMFKDLHIQKMSEKIMKVFVRYDDTQKNLIKVLAYIAMQKSFVYLTEFATYCISSKVLLKSKNRDGKKCLFLSYI